MRIRTKLVRDSNSWAVRLPKAVLAQAGLKPDAELTLDVSEGKLVIRPKGARPENLPAKQARLDAKKHWDKAFEQAWLEAYGLDE